MKPALGEFRDDAIMELSEGAELEVRVLSGHSEGG